MTDSASEGSDHAAAGLGRVSEGCEPAAYCVKLRFHASTFKKSRRRIEISSGYRIEEVHFCLNLEDAESGK